MGDTSNEMCYPTFHTLTSVGRKKSFSVCQEMLPLFRAVLEVCCVFVCHFLILFIYCRALEALSNRRPFVTTRSTYPSNGKYAGHWLGDNLSAWSEMHKSIIGMLEFGLFGIPYVGLT